MRPTNEQQDRWIAYLVGEIPEGDRAAIEAELAAHPEAAAELRRVVDAASGWAKAPVSAGESDVVLYRANASTRRPRPWYALPIGLAAAAALMFAVSQANFTVSFGDTKLSWGASGPVVSAPIESSPAFAALQERDANLGEIVEALAVQTALLQENFDSATNELAYTQYVDRQTRYQEMQQLLQLAGYVPEPAQF
jgi:anti-sigma factor RsiW